MPDETIAMAEAQPTASHKETDRIRLSVIPSALDELDLPCDLDIIATFEQAAESDDDEDEEMGVRGDGPAKESITRERFLQVCAALMGDSEDEAEEQPEEPRRRRQRPGKEKADEYDEGDSDSEEVAEPGSKRLTRAARKSMKGKQAALPDGDEELSNVEEDEETVTAATTASATKAKKASKKKSLASERVLNPEQLQVVSDMFANFFENKPAQGTDSGSLGLAEVRYVATLLGENLTDGDVSAVLHSISYTERCGRYWRCSNSLQRALRIESRCLTLKA